MLITTHPIILYLVPFVPVHSYKTRLTLLHGVGHFKGGSFTWQFAYQKCQVSVQNTSVFLQ